MKSTITLLALTTTMSVALGAICNGKGLCMSLEISQSDHFRMTCSFNSDGRTVPADSIEWKISAPGLDPTGMVLPDGYSQICRLYMFGPLGLKDYGYAMLRCKI